MNHNETLLDVRGMNCGSCVRHIAKALDALDGVEEVHPSLPDKTVRVRHNPARVSADQLASALTAKGYPAAARAA
ncbi:MAG: heavy metal-associated domain-containing protein [Deltaproteobacteria bacterium]|nr:heavy metal-associated domain-containing protein [Myxococcales bacterium]MDP3215000.1 heavy metal-associated domain-containing protein [Deltaproteobacteria bacterium]